MARRDGKPIWLGDKNQTGHALTRIMFEPGSQGDYNEKWLQNRVQSNPEIFPIAQIEPDFGRLVPICTELPLELGGGKTGSLDNFLITDQGQLLLIETKLWKNPEARREVVAQALDYAAAIFRMTFEKLDGAVRKARISRGHSDQSLFEIVFNDDPDEQDEAWFVDRITRNLRSGRAIVAVLGDGIREDVIALSNLLQTHVGQRFVFALIEVAIYKAPEGEGHLLLPSVLAQTTLIERGVVRLAASSTESVASVEIEAPTVRINDQARNKSTGLSEDEFYEIIEAKQAGSAKLLRDFVARADDHGVFVEMQGGMNLKHPAPSGNPLNFASITKNLTVNSGPSTWFGRHNIAAPYNQRLADLIDAEVVKESDQVGHKIRHKNGKMPVLGDLLPEHADAWLEEIDAYKKRIFASEM